MLRIADINVRDTIRWVHGVDNLEAIPFGRAGWQAIAGWIIDEGRSGNAGKLDPRKRRALNLDRAVDRQTSSGRKIDVSSRLNNQIATGRNCGIRSNPVGSV